MNTACTLAPIAANLKPTLAPFHNPAKHHQAHPDKHGTLKTT